MSTYFNYKDDFRNRGTGYKASDSGDPTLENLKASNPYKNRLYNESPWQQFLSSLGFRTEVDSFRENMQVQAAEYDAQMALMQYENEYNSPTQQVARMRAAGLNPDISGGNGIDSGNTSGPSQDPSTPMQTSDEEHLFVPFVQGVFSIFSTAVGIISNFQGIKGKSLENKLLALQNDKEELDLSTGLNDYAKDSLSSILPESPEPTINEDGSAESWQGEALKRARIFSKTLPKKFRGQFISSVQGFWNSVGGSKEAYESWRQRVENRKGYEVDSRTNYSHVESDLKLITDEIGKLNSELEKGRLKSGIAKSEAETTAAELSADIDSGTDAGTAAAARNAGNEAALGQRDIDAAINSTVSRITKKLSKNDDLFSQLLLILLYGEKNNLLPKIR